MKKIKIQSGFTLIEIAIVLLIVAILLGYSVAMFPMQQELKQYRKAESQLDDIVDHIVGFAQVNGRLPCPDTSGDINGTGAGTVDGAEDTDDLVDNVTGVAGADTNVDNCKSFYGFLPTATLGLTGDIAPNGTFLDPWGQAYRYHVSNVDAGGAPGIDLISPNGIRAEGLANVTPDLSVCDDSNNPSAADANCGVLAGPPNTIIGNAAVVIYSSGKDVAAPAFASNIQVENRDDFHDGRNDRVYTSSVRSDVDNAEYDDKLRWISPNLLFSRMIEADRLP